MKNNGITNELFFINYINQKKYINNMNENIRAFLKYIFDFNLENKEIKAYKFAENYKPDIIITANGFSKYISIKTGNSNSIHQEHIYSFCNYLQELKIDNKTINSLKQFHFNDGSLNGSGTKRKSANEFQSNNIEVIKEINKVLNKTENKSKIIDRLLFKGEYYHLPIVDFIYYGDIEKGWYASSDEIRNLLINNSNCSYSIHVSKLYYQSLHRNLKYDKYYEYRRYYVQFKWYSVKDDLFFLMKKRQ